MAKRKQVANHADRKMEAAFGWLPMSEITGPIRPTKRYASKDLEKVSSGAPLCDTPIQFKQLLLADKILRASGFYDANIELRAWLEEPENKQWAIAANPDAITSDGHLSASACFL